MAKITYVALNGEAHVVDVNPGLSVMEGAKKNNVPGIDADCGGACQCGTCHVYIDPVWQGRSGVRTDLEDAILEFAEDVMPNSRLACQIEVTEELDGLVVRIPNGQH
jgi:ferredoxin, 2Fe-2S